MSINAMEETINRKENSIREFYRDAKVFITGGSGFIGRVLIEKLLRSCPDIDTIYLLMRPKKNVKGADRIHQVTNCLLFEQLIAQNPRAIDKIKVVEGDVKELGLGLSDVDTENLKSCSVIFHSAASVRFDDPLRDAILLNTRGTREICKLAEKMCSLKALVHVSTAFVQPKKFYTEEKTVTCNFDWRQYIKFAENLDDDLVSIMTEKLTEFAPNTYTFTKNLAEQVCGHYATKLGLPIVIYRPSIVTVTDSDPFPGWFDNLNGPMGLVMAGALGIFHVCNIDINSKMDMIQVDFCIKGMIIASWKKWKDRQQMFIKPEPTVYNATSTILATYRTMKLNFDEIIGRNPSIQMFGIPNVTYTTCKFYFWMILIFRQIIPAIIVDGILMLSGKKPKLMKIQRIIYVANTSLNHFKQAFGFENFRFLDLNSEVSDDEKKDFFMKQILSKSEFYHTAYKNGVKIILKETPEQAVKAKERYRYVYFVTKTIHMIFVFTVYKLLCKLLTNIF